MNAMKQIDETYNFFTKHNNSIGSDRLQKKRVNKQNQKQLKLY